MAYQISPAVTVTETDLTNVIPAVSSSFFHQGQLVIRTAGRKQKDEFIHSLLREKNELFPKRA
jgi:hypothetical protein